MRTLRLILVFILTAMSSVFAATADLTITPVASGLSSPLAIAAPGDNSGRLFIVERSGRILLKRGHAAPTVFLDIQPRVSCCNERGLLGMAFHPDFANTSTFYINYTDVEFNTIIAAYQVSANPDQADFNSEAVLLLIPQPFANHNGGQLAFGPDGYLYIGTGDGGGVGDPNNNAQNGQSLLGKILRIHVVPGQPYTIPAGNPFIGNPAFRDEIWALGLRNPYRFSFDRVTGDLLIADVGQSVLEEVNFQSANAGGGQNYGWRRMEGNQCFNPGSGCESSDFTMPAFQYQNAGARCSIIGGYRYRGSANPELQGSYIFGDFCSGEILAARLNSNQQWVQEVLLDTALMISSFAEDDNGELLVVDLKGTVYRLLASLAISPASGIYLSSQSIDLAVIMAAQQAAVTGYAVALNGQEITSALDSCGIATAVAGDGISLRCPGIPLSSLGAGSHTLRVELQFSDGSALRSSATWQILEVVN